MVTRPSRVLNSGIVVSLSGSQVQSDAQEVRTRRFGVFELDLRAGELRRSGVKVKLQEQPFQVLALLLEKPGEVVSRDDLRNRLWPADTFVDFDHSLNAAIKRLRDALGDSAENPTFVETVARRGYRFLAPVSATTANGNGAPSAPAAAIPAAVPAPQPVVQHFRLWWIAAPAAFAVLLLGIKLGLSLAKHHPRDQAQSRISQLTANPADDRVRAAAISRDGNYLAFSDETGFYLRQIDTGETHPVELPKDMMATSISWFPDSDHMVVALSAPAQPSGLWQISVLGGNARKLCDDGRYPAVSPDGRQIAFINGKRMNEKILVMDADGTQTRTLTGHGGDFFGAVAWSPDGTKVAYTRGQFSYSYGVKGSIELVELHDLRASSLLQVASMGWFVSLDGPLAWASDGHIIYSFSEAPPRQLDSNLWTLAIDAQGNTSGTPVRLTNDPGAVIAISTSADGKRTAYLKGVPQPDVYIARLAGGYDGRDGRDVAGEPQRLTLDDRQDIPFDWTPDGKSVFFISDRTGIFKLYRQAIDQTVPELLVGGDRPIMTPRLSPDGSQLLYLVYPGWSDHNLTTSSLMRMPLAGGPPQMIAEENFIGNQQCARAPATLCLYSVVSDGALVFYSFDPITGKGPQVYQLKAPLTQAYNWSLSPDGTTLAIAKGKEGGEDPVIHLISLNSAASPPTLPTPPMTTSRSKSHMPLLTTPAYPNGNGISNAISNERSITVQGWQGIASLDWAADSKSLWAPTVGEEGNALLNIDLQGRAHVAWRPKKLTVGWAIPSRDGRYLALHVGSTSANVWMLERP